MSEDIYTSWDTTTLPSAEITQSSSRVLAPSLTALSIAGMVFSGISPRPPLCPSTSSLGCASEEMTIQQQAQRDGHLTTLKADSFIIIIFDRKICRYLKIYIYSKICIHSNIHHYSKIPIYCKIHILPLISSTPLYCTSAA